MYVHPGLQIPTLFPAARPFGRMDSECHVETIERRAIKASALDMEDECNAAHLFSVCSMGARCICLAIYGSPIRALSLQAPLYTGSRYIRARCIRARLYTDSLYTDSLYTDSLYTDSLYSIAMYGLAVYGPRYYGLAVYGSLYTRSRCAGSLYTGRCRLATYAFAVSGLSRCIRAAQLASFGNSAPSSP